MGEGVGRVREESGEGGGGEGVREAVSVEEGETERGPGREGGGVVGLGLGRFRLFLHRRCRSVFRIRDRRRRRIDNHHLVVAAVNGLSRPRHLLPTEQLFEPFGVDEVKVREGKGGEVAAVLGDAGGEDLGGEENVA